MMEFIYNLTGDMLYFFTVGAVFFCMTILWMVIALKGRNKLEAYQENFTSSAEANMGDMFMSVDPDRLFKMNIAALVVLPALIWFLTHDIATALAVFILVLVLPSMFYASMRKKRLRRFEQQLPDALMMVSGAMRAGASLSIALESLVKEQPAPVSQEFDLFLREQRVGADFEGSLAKMEKRIPLQDFSMLVTALRINREVGGNLAETIETLAETLRRKASMEGKIQSLTAQGKLQGVVMTGLPLLLGLLLNFMEPEAMSMLWTTPIGWGVMIVVVIMEGLGYFMIRKITSIDV